MKLLLISLVSLVLLYTGTVTYIVVKDDRTEITMCASDAWFYTLYFFRTIGHSYMMAAKRLETICEKQLTTFWNAVVAIWQAFTKKVELLLIAYFMLYDFFRLDCKGPKDLTENTMSISSTPINTADVGNIFEKYAKPILEEKAAGMSIEEAKKFWQDIATRLATVPNAARSIEVELGILTQKGGDYFVRSRFLIHKENYDDVTPAATEEFEARCVAAVDDDVVDNVIYLNPNIKEVVEAAQKVAQSILPTGDDELDMDESIARQTISHFLGLDFMLISCESAMKFYALMARLCDRECYTDIDPNDEDLNLMYREMLLDHIVNPYKAKHKMCEYEELEYHPCGKPVAVDATKVAVNEPIVCDAIPSFLARPIVDDGESFVFGSRKNKGKLSEAEIDAIVEQKIAEYKASPEYAIDQERARLDRIKYGSPAEQEAAATKE